MSAALRRVCVAAMVVTGLYGAALAADSKQLLAKITADPEERQHVVATAQKSLVMLKNPCADASFDILDSVAIYTPVALGADGKIVAGAWSQSVAEKGCGESRILNVFLSADADHDLTLVPMFPGTTRTDTVMQKDALMFAVTAIGGLEKDCASGYVADTKFKQEGRPGGGLEAPWDEIWTLVSCSKKAEVTMHFIPDKTGTTIAANKFETKFLPYEAKPAQ